MQEQIKYLNEAIKGLKDSSYYSIEVSLFPGNPPFNAILFTGFIESTGHQAIFTIGSSEEKTVPSQYPNALVKIINKIEFNEKYPEWSRSWMEDRKYNKYGNRKGEGK